MRSSGAQQAAGAAGGGVSSFNGRAGVVLPQSGDYTAEMVGADAAGSAEAVQKNLDAHTSDKDNPHGVTAAQVGADAAARVGGDRQPFRAYRQPEQSTQRHGGAGGSRPGWQRGGGAGGVDNADG